MSTTPHRGYDLLPANSAQPEVFVNAAISAIDVDMAAALAGSHSSDASDSSGTGLPAGGTTGQVLTKRSSTAGDADWETPTTGGGGGGGGLNLTDEQGATFSAVSSLNIQGAIVQLMTSDASFANVSLLLPMLSDLIDKSGHYTVAGSWTPDTAHHEFGVASMDFGSNSREISVGIPNGSALDLSSGDFTVEAWVYPTSLGSEVFFCTTYLGHYFWGTPSGAASCKVEGATVPSPAFTANAWQHIALVVESNQATCFVNGTPGGAPVAVTRSAYSGETLYIGGSQYGASYYGNMQQFRVTKGLARYPGGSAFTAPTAPFPTHGGSGGAGVQLVISGASTVAGLPTSPTAGQRSFVTDATATTFLSIVAGGGSNKVPVVHDGANWLIG